MECEIDKKVEAKCSTCAYGNLGEDEEPCLTCYNSMVNFSQWVLKPDYRLNQACENAKTYMQDKGIA